LKRSLVFNKLIKYLILGMFLCLAYENSFSQDNTPSDAKREEIQRYVGYETLIYRYLSLPYDVTMGINERGTGFLDIGFLILMFLPILFMIKYRHRKLIAFGIPLIMLILLVVSTSNSFIFDTGKRTMELNKDGTNHYTIDSETTLNDRIIRSVYNIDNILYKPFDKFSQAFSGDKDNVTYPIVLAIFCLAFCLLIWVSKSSSQVDLIFIGSVFLAYTFYWFILSPGIIWYGFLAILLSYLVLILLLPNKEEKTILTNFSKYSFYSLAGLWITIAMVHRISNINLGGDPSQMGKTMQSPVFIQNLAGDTTDDQVMDMFYPGTSSIMRMINSDRSDLVYRIGTSFSYFIEHNNERVLTDNMLGFFNALTNEFPDKVELATAMSKSKLKYLIIDLNTPTLDNTPEQTLKTKYDKVINFVYENPRVKLLATNRVVTKADDGSQNTQRYYDMFGSKILSNGTFAIYQIL
jgi:hypothetical protein